MFSFGVVLWEIVTRKLPFINYSFNFQVVDAVIAGERPAIPNDCNPDIKLLIQDCWVVNLTQRPSFKDIEIRIIDVSSACL